MVTSVSSCGPSRSCAWRTSAASGRPICLGDRDGDPCGLRAEVNLGGMGFCRSCALKVAAAVTKHEDLSILDSDVIERRRTHRQSVQRQLCYAALIGGYLQVAVSVDPESAVQKQPGARLLFVLNGHGPRVQRDAHHRLVNSRADDLGNNFFRLTTEVVDWLGEEQDTLLDLRAGDQEREPVQAS